MADQHAQQAASSEQEPAAATSTPEPAVASNSTDGAQDSNAAPDESIKETSDDKTTAAAATDSSAASPLQELFTTFKSQSHPEIWGVTLSDPSSHVPSQVIFQKYLNANDGDVVRAKDQLLKTLAWRAEAKPLELMARPFDPAKFEGLGYVTSYGVGEGQGETTDPDHDPEQREVFTWNIYGAAAKKMTETFGDLDEFIAWRVALMELAVARLNLGSASKPITAEHDPYKLFQVHDYQSISFLRQSPEVKAASTKTISVFAQNYPELLKEKFFVNVPAIMGFMYSFMKLFVAAKTAKKFHPMSNGGALANEFAESKVESLGEKLPASYGGKGGDLKDQGATTQLVKA